MNIVKFPALTDQDPRQAKRTFAILLAGITVLVLSTVVFFTGRGLAQLKKENLLRYKAWADDLSTQLDSQIISSLSHLQTGPEGGASGSVAVLDVPQFLDESIGRAFGRSPLAGRAVISVNRDAKPLYLFRRSKRGLVVRESVKEWPGDLVPLHSPRRLPNPLEAYEIRVLGKHVPYTGGRHIVLTAAILLGLIVPLGLCGVYWMGAQYINLAKQRSDFAAAVSHELRTPLAALQLRLEALTEGWVGAGNREEYYALMLEDSRRLSELVECILQLTGTSTGECELVSVDIGLLIRESISRLNGEISAAGFRIASTGAAGHETAVLNPALFEVIVGNLVANSLKFSRESQRKEIAITLRREGTRISLTVRDFGPGISPGALESVGEIFRRGTDDLTRRTRGTGIGLALVKQAAERMNAGMEFTNAEPGLSVTLSFPCTA